MQQMPYICTMWGEYWKCSFTAIPLFQCSLLCEKGLRIGVYLSTSDCTDILVPAVQPLSQPVRLTVPFTQGSLGCSCATATNGAIHKLAIQSSFCQVAGQRRHAHNIYCIGKKINTGWVKVLQIRRSGRIT